MFGIPGKAAVTLTPAAIRQITKLMDREGHQGLRIGVKKGGCAGMEYTMDYVDAQDPHDEVVEQDGARILIAPMAQMFLFGTEIDYEVSLLEAGFKFLILSALSSAVLLYGLVYLYGATGTTDIAGILESINNMDAAGDRAFGSSGLMLGVVMVVAGFGFKMAIAPFQIPVTEPRSVS